MHNLKSRPMPGKRSGIQNWAEYTKITLYPSSVRSWRDAHSAIDNFAKWITERYNGLVTQKAVNEYGELLADTGNSPSTINTKLCYVSRLLITMGEKFQIPYVTRKKVRKWWLTDELWVKLKAWLEGGDGRSELVKENANLLLDYIMWERETGLRVEESLRLLPDDFVKDFHSLVVPGTKTVESGVIIPLSNEARAIAMRRAAGSRHIFNGRTYVDKRLFDISYTDLRDAWNECRKFLGVDTDPTSTLKSLRRTFAANCLLNKEMPAAMIQELMRHTDLQTTMGYLKLVGLADNQQTRDMLNRGAAKLAVDNGPFTPASAAYALNHYTFFAVSAEFLP